MSVIATIAASPERVLEVFTDVCRWPAMFPEISSVRVEGEDGSGIDVSVHHRLGLVPNRLEVRRPDTVWLQERKPGYDATFVNRFDRLPDGRTRYRILADIRLRGWRRLLDPFVGGYVRRTLMHLTVQPLRRAVESTSST